MPEKFSLKDFLFNETKVTQVAENIQKTYPEFQIEKFIKRVVDKFPELKLKERITWIVENFKEFLPQDYRQAVQILLNSLPPENDNTKSDDDFGDFIYAPFSEFVARYGCNKNDLFFSLNALKEITTRFSAEDSIRYFINAFPEETLKELLKWSSDPHYHVRRLASEGTRPKLPWSQKISISPEEALPILNNLYFDKTRFVTRSIANHMNDISKSNPELVLKTLKKWKESKKQNSKEMDFIIIHSLRTLVKLGNPEAIKFLGFSPNPQVEVLDFKIKDSPIKIGDTLEFEFKIKSKEDEKLIIDYIIYFQDKRGNGNSKKVFKIKKIEMKKSEVIIIQKKHPFRKNMTTRKLYPGKHKIELQINGKKLKVKNFDLK